MDYAYLHIFFLLLCICSSHAHKCEHDKYVASRNVKVTVSPQNYANHPFETAQEDSDTPRRLGEANWEPIRIHADYSEITKHTFGSTAKSTLDNIMSSIIPAAIKMLSKYLTVIRVDGNLKVTTANGKNNKCDEITVPASHSTIGIPNADVVLYIKASEEDAGDTMAWSLACRTDQHGRPLAGLLHLNVADIWGTSAPNTYKVQTLVHEMSHALGWTQDLFETFRDGHGHLRSNVLTSTHALGKKITLLSTPAVTSRVRSYFGCNSLAGMELEDQGGITSAGSHPEKRIFPETYMTADSFEDDFNYIIDAMALSVFQDSGWYQVKHLDQAGRLSWGRGLGCRVATHKCNDFGPEANARGLFCSEDWDGFCTGNNMHVQGYCNVKEYKSALPVNFQYFPSSPKKGGDAEMEDYCPRAVQYNNGDCTDTSFTDLVDVHYGTAVGSDSRCFYSSLLSQKAPAEDLVADPQCYRRTCHAHTLDIHVMATTVTCPLSTHASAKTVQGYDGYIVCPPYSGLGDIRCTPTCDQKDPECLGKKGSAVDFSGKVATMDDLLSGDVFGGGNTDGDIVVVHGRHLRH